MYKIKPPLTFIRYKYDNVQIIFIAHSAEAKEVSEDEFFHKGESGGTLISTGYAKALEVIEQRYNPAVWNIYVFHSSDGDNWLEDNEQSIKLAEELCRTVNLFGYGEITPNHIEAETTISREYKEHLKADNFVMVNITKKEDVWPAFKKLLDKEGGLGEAQP